MCFMLVVLIYGADFGFHIQLGVVGMWLHVFFFIAV